MTRMVLPILFALPILALGCFSTDAQLTQVPQNPFGQAAPSPTTTRASLAPASLECAARVDRIGTQIAKANKDHLGFQPLWSTIGAPQPEILHRGATEVMITEGLVKQCSTDGQLAAVLCHELGRMRAEMETRAGVQLPERVPPMQVADIGGDFGGFGSPDQLHRAEVGKYDEQRRQKIATFRPPDPRALAATYLTRAGFAPGELDNATPLLNLAAENGTFARQMLAPIPGVATPVGVPPGVPLQPAK
jgi:hypothetical protein